ncbi:hypothetical protein [Streptomyces sp. CB01881]|uniref:hypothetical protein n=1 Tax=Streptomyces sp. CB01881 TaxID=2078691 RepID=UPI000CDC8B0E|nr:hypothetical protein [Streptomyces sp. CB01881]AUY47681.1 hypothetical protein C2142_00390 [Streptomyces sp. CB01881]TYC76155.1 hypothetical protein EH183_00390 [Streptomyces sp. CB01881]
MRSARPDASTRLHGYGIRWDQAARLYRVRNEFTGAWLRDNSGALLGFSSFTAADRAWRSFEPHRRVA